MQRRQSVLLPGESAPHAYSRNITGPTNSVRIVGQRQAMPTGTGAQRPPLNGSIGSGGGAAGGAATQPYLARESVHMREYAPNSDNYARAQERGAAFAAAELTQEYRAGAGSVNMDDYFKGVLNQFKDDSAIMNPMNISIESINLGAEKDQGETGAIIAKLAQQTAAAKSSIVGLDIPIAHSAIDDTRIFFDTLILPQAYAGYTTGEIPMQFVEFNGVSPPDRIVKITLSSFNFPHVYLPTSTVFDVFYFRSVFMTIRFVPTTHLIQTASPNELFTFELYVNNIDSSAVYLTPVEPSFILKQPVSVTGDLTVKFQVRSPSGGFINCPIPPTRVQVARVSTIAIPPTTTFRLMSNVYIGILAPPGSTYSVPIIFQQFNPAVAPSNLERLFVTPTGTIASGFTINIGPPERGEFTVPINSTSVPGSDEPFFIFIPKNGVSFNMRFSSLQSMKTNDLIPIHM